MYWYYVLLNIGIRTIPMFPMSTGPSGMDKQIWIAPLLTEVRRQTSRKMQHPPAYPPVV